MTNLHKQNKPVIPHVSVVQPIISLKFVLHLFPIKTFICSQPNRKLKEVLIQGHTTWANQGIVHVLRATAYPQKKMPFFSRNRTYTQLTLSRETHVAQLVTGFMALGSHLTPLSLGSLIWKRTTMRINCGVKQGMLLMMSSFF